MSFFNFRNNIHMDLKVKTLKVNDEDQKKQLLLKLLSQRNCDNAIVLFEQINDLEKEFYDKIFTLLSQKGLIAKIKIFFDQMLNKGIKPNIYTYNILLRHFTKINDQDNYVNFLLSSIKDNNIKYDNHTIEILITYYAKKKNFEMVKSTVETMKRLKIPSSSKVFTTLIKVYSMSGKNKMIEDVIEMIENSNFTMNEFSYHQIIQHFYQLKQIDKIIDLYESIKIKKVNIDQTLLSLLKNIFTETGNEVYLKEVQTMFKEKFQKDAFYDDRKFINICKTNSIVEIEQEFQKIPNKNIFLYNNIIKAFGIQGNIEKVEEYVNKMIMDKINPDVYTLNALLQCFIKKKDFVRFDGAIYEFKYIKWDKYTYSCMIEYSKYMHYENKILEILENMISNKIQPDIKVYSEILSAYSTSTFKVMNFEEILSHIESQNLSFTHQTYELILKYFKKTENKEKLSFYLNKLENDSIEKGQYLMDIIQQTKNYLSQ